MKLIKTISAYRAWMQNPARAQGSIGFVPTMGALHAGHQFLLERAREENDLVVLSIYKNPTQFNDPRDLAHYPGNLEDDLKMAEWMGIDVVFMPSYEDMYPDGYQFRVTESDLSTMMEGVHRPGHFDGVLTVILKFLNVVQASRAYFGKKDFQQLELVRRMAEAFLSETEIIGCATIREADGLAYSSRNALLSKADRQLAGAFPQILRTSLSLKEVKTRLIEAGFEVEYIEEHFDRRFGAVRLGDVRLIDNVSLKSIGSTAPLTDDNAFQTKFTKHSKNGEGLMS